MMRLVLRFGGTLVAVSREGFFDVAGHAEVDIAFLVVPVKGQTKVKGTVPIGVAGVVLFEGFEEMLDIILVDVFYSEVLNNKGKADGAP